jgi:hypothetical protein
VAVAVLGGSVVAVDVGPGTVDVGVGVGLPFGVFLGVGSTGPAYAALSPPAPTPWATGSRTATPMTAASTATAPRLLGGPECLPMPGSLPRRRSADTPAVTLGDGSGGAVPK